MKQIGLRPWTVTTSTMFVLISAIVSVLTGFIRGWEGLEEAIEYSFWVNIELVAFGLGVELGFAWLFYTGIGCYATPASYFWCLISSKSDRGYLFPLYPSVLSIDGAQCCGNCSPVPSCFISVVRISKTGSTIRIDWGRRGL